MARMETGHTNKMVGFLIVYFIFGPIAVAWAEQTFAPRPDQFSGIPTIVFSLALLVIVFAIPWWSSRWVRVLRKWVSAENPEAIVEIVKFWGPPKSPLLWRVILVNQSGISVLAKKSLTSLGWDSVGSLDVLAEGMFPEASIQVFSKEGEVLMRFAPTARKFNLKRLDVDGVKQLSGSMSATRARFESSRPAR